MSTRYSNTRFETRNYNESERESTTRRITSYLRSLARSRNSGTVTADDVHRYLDRDGVRAQQIRTRLSFINSVFGSGMFEQVGMTNSARPAAKGRTISKWTMA